MGSLTYKTEPLKINTSTYLILFFIFLCSLTSYGQERRKIQIDTSGFITKNEKNYPGATILTRDNMNQVKISHEGIIMWCDEAIHYGSQDFIEAYGNVKNKPRRYHYHDF